MGEEETCCWDCRQSFLPKNWPRHRNSLRHLRQILRPRPWGWGRERRPATERFRPPLGPCERGALCPMGETVRFRPGRRGADGCTDAGTWPVRELGGRRRWSCCISPVPRARTAAATGAGPLGRAAHEPPAQPRFGLERPLPFPLDQLLNPPDAILRNGPIVWRGAAARNGRDAARVSGRTGPIQLRNRAGNSGGVITPGIGAFEVCLWPPLDQGACKAI